MFSKIPRRWLMRTIRRNCIPCIYLGLAVTVLNIIGIPRLIRQLMVNPATIEYFTQQATEGCGGNFHGYVHQFAHLKKVIVDPGRAKGRPGGEDISEVMGQAESEEYFKLLPGYFRLPCRQVPDYLFWGESHLNEWLAVVRPQSTELSANDVLRKGVNRVQKIFTIAITRYEYANLYHAISDIYNAYIMMRVFSQIPIATDILFIDGHPEGSLDGLWKTLFGDVIRAGHVKEPVLYENLVWSIYGYSCPFHRHKKPVIPELNGFTDFVLGRHHVVLKETLNCSNISVLFIWRRNYVAHPRNPVGIIDRKISNAHELATKVLSSLTNGGEATGTVRGVHLEELGFAEQLQMISQTDILIGMHGAGLSHTLFLPAHAGLLELFPKDLPSINRHFQAMARWRNLHYLQYQNYLDENELTNGWTRFVADDIVKLVKNMRKKLCGNNL